MSSIPQWQAEFWAMLPRLGLFIANQPEPEIRRIHQRVQEMGDFPLEWMKPLEETARGNGVMNIRKVLDYMEYAIANELKPGERPTAKAEAEPTAEETDRLIADFVHRKVERFADVIVEPGATTHSMRAAWPAILRAHSDCTKCDIRPEIPSDDWWREYITPAELEAANG